MSASIRCRLSSTFWLLALARAIDAYDCTSGPRLLTYAGWLRGLAKAKRYQLRAVVRRAHLADSLDVPIGDDAEGPTRLDQLQAPGEGAEIELAELDSNAVVSERVRAAVAKLSPAQRAVIEARHLAAEPETLGDLAARTRLHPSTLRHHEYLGMSRLSALLQRERGLLRAA